MIDQSSLIRQLTIELITDTPNEIFTWFNDLWNKLNIIETDVHHKNGGEFIYYMIIGNKKSGIFFQDNKNERFWCSYNLYWSILESKFNLNADEIQVVTQLLVENALNYNVAPPKAVIMGQTGVENALNYNVALPYKLGGRLFHIVDNALNNITND